jgi:hypothetical protein
MSRGLVSGLVPNALPTPLNPPGRAPQTGSGLNVAAKYVRVIRTFARAAKRPPLSIPSTSAFDHQAGA